MSTNKRISETGNQGAAVQETTIGLFTFRKPQTATHRKTTIEKVLHSNATFDTLIY